MKMSTLKQQEFSAKKEKDKKLAHRAAELKQLEIQKTL